MNNVADVCSILLVDDHPLIRVGIKQMLSLHSARKGRAYTAHEAGDYLSAIRMVEQHAPAIAIIELSTRGPSEMSLVKKLRAMKPDMAILVFSMHDENIYAERSLRAGANGYVMKNAELDELVRAIDHICEGKIWLSEDMKNNLCSKAVNNSLPLPLDHKEALAKLSDRELEIFKLIGQGLKKSEIMQRTNLSTNTIETHRMHIKQKLGIQHASELNRLAFLHFKQFFAGASFTPRGDSAHIPSFGKDNRVAPG